jgi:hypothetical protein
MEGIPIPWEEKALIGNAEHLGIPRARNGHRGAAGRGGASGKPQTGAPEQGGAAGYLQRVFKLLAHVSPCLSVLNSLGLCLTKATLGVEVFDSRSPGYPFSLDPQAPGR